MTPEEKQTLQQAFQWREAAQVLSRDYRQLADDLALHAAIVTYRENHKSRFMPALDAEYEQDTAEDRNTLGQSIMRMKNICEDRASYLPADWLRPVVWHKPLSVSGARNMSAAFNNAAELLDFKVKALPGGPAPSWKDRIKSRLGL